jgi:hypothetical protein
MSSSDSMTRMIGWWLTRYWKICGRRPGQSERHQSVVLRLRCVPYQSIYLLLLLLLPCVWYHLCGFCSCLSQCSCWRCHGACYSPWHHEHTVEIPTLVLLGKIIIFTEFKTYHVNEEASRLLNVQHLIRRLKRTKPFELVKQFDNWGIRRENLAPRHVNILVIN